MATDLDWGSKSRSDCRSETCDNMHDYESRVETVRMAPTDTYVGNAIGDGPMMVQPFCAIEIYDEAGNRIGRGPYDGRSLLEVEMKPPGYALQLQPNDRISLDRRDSEKPFRTVVRLAIYVGREWKEIVLEKK